MDRKKSRSTSLNTKHTINTKLFISKPNTKIDSKSEDRRIMSSVTPSFLKPPLPIFIKTASKTQNLDHKKLSKSPLGSDKRPLPELFKPHAVGVDSSGRRYLAIPLGTKKPAVIGLDDIGTRGIQILNHHGAGLLTPASRNRFMASAEETAKQDPSFKVMARVGLEAGAEHFALGPSIIRRKGADLAYSSLDPRIPTRLTQQFGHAGTLEGWQQITEYAPGNHIFVVLLSLGFVGPVNAVVGHVNSSFMLFGRAGTGKTALCAAVTSIYGWGDPTKGSARLGFGFSLNGTENALEHALASRRHTFAFLDEIALQGEEGLRSTAAFVKAMIFKLEDGSSKQRLTEIDGPLDFQVPVVLTSNHSAQELSRHSPQPFERQDYDRMIDIGVPDRPSGVFDTLHGFENLGALICHLSNIAAENHGLAGRRFVQWLLDRHAEDHSALAQKCEKFEAEFITKLKRDPRLPPTAGFERVIRSFARIYAAGALANASGVLPLKPSDVGPAVLSCCVDYLQRHEGCSVAPQPPHSPLLALKQFISEHERELPMFSKKLSVAEIQSIGAFSGMAGDVLLTLAKFDALVGGSREGKRLRRDLEQQGAIGITKNGSGPSRKVVRFYVEPSKKMIELIQIKLDRLAKIEA